MTHKIILGESTHPLIKANATVDISDFKNTLILGDSQSKISDLVYSFTKQLINQDSGLIVFDLNDSFDDEFLQNLPAELHSRIEVFDPTHFENIPGLNILDVKEIDQDEEERPDLKKAEKAVDAIYNMFERIYNFKALGGPIIEAYFKNTLKLAVGHPGSGASIAIAYKILTNEDFRSFKLAMCDDKNVIDFWEKEVHTFVGADSFENMAPYLAAKLAPFVLNGHAFSVVAQSKTTVDFKSSITDNKIIFIRLDSSKLGVVTQEFLGMVVLAQIELDLAEISKSNIKSANKPTILVPNLEKFINQNFINILSQYHRSIRFVVSANSFESLNINGTDYFKEIKNYFPNEIKFRNNSNADLVSLKDNQALFSIHLDDNHSQSIILNIEKSKEDNNSSANKAKSDFYIKRGMVESEIKKKFDEQGELMF